MNKEINTIKLYVKDTPKAHEVESIVRGEIIKNNLLIDNASFQLSISIGGDGTFLKMLRDNRFNSDIYYASINAGSLGFLSSTDGQIAKFINDITNKNFNVRELNILKSSFYNENKVGEVIGINEFTVRKTDFSSFKCDIFVDDELLDKFNGDGLVISTSIGSTGYNMALGGAIVDTDIKTLSITPIAPIINKVYKSFTNSIVISAKRKITIVFNDNNNLCYLIDGKMGLLNNINKIECVLTNDTIKCIMPIGYNYINNIRNKVIDSKE